MVGQAGARAGTSFVPLTPQLVRASLAQSERGLPLVWRAAPIGTRAAGPASTDLDATWTGLALRPWSPCHLEARAGSGGDIALSWIRRARLHGDSLDGEPPLGEERETWQVEISTPDGWVVRTLTSDTAGATYSAADQRTDFPAGRSGPLTVCVRQGSAIYGWGAPAYTQLL